MTDERRFSPGAQVTCDAFRGIGEVSEGPNAKGEYRVALGNLSLWIKGENLKLFQSGDRKKKNSSSKRKILHTYAEPSGVEPLRLDLHGMKVLEAVDALERSIDQAILKNAPKIEIIHGIGSGTLKHAISEYLAKCSHVAKYHLDENNPGTTWAYL